MQIDFHHGVTYVCVRLAGFAADEAAIVAHAAQYVDDATLDGPLAFKTGERYTRVTSAHKMVDFKILNTVDNRLVWVPFHFLPGNDQPPKGAKDGALFLYRAMCKPDSAIAREMVADCIGRQDLAFGLHRFGIALHTYADTWAHQQFVGTVCELNRLTKLEAIAEENYAKSGAFHDLTSVKAEIEQHLATFAPVGHAGALTYPDLPFLHWSFTRANGEKVLRDNRVDFLAAAEAMFNMARRYKAKDASLASVALPAADRAAIDSMLRTTQIVEGELRHQKWLEAIAGGRFSFGAEKVGYVEQGPGSWKHDALGADPDEDIDYDFTAQFMTSNWKRFHDAVQFQRLYIVHELLPKHGLCVA